jgi:predicted nucleotide-binding protein (sugar kinase/HSP70/actin superfamily)
LQQFKAFIKYLNTTYNKAFDPAVYGKNNNMEAINQSKQESPDRVQNIFEDDIYKNRLITAFIDSSAKSILDITDFDKYICSYNRKTGYTWGQA